MSGIFMNPKKHISLLAILLMILGAPLQIKGETVYQRNENGVRAMDAGNDGTAVEYVQRCSG